MTANPFKTYPHRWGTASRFELAHVLPGLVAVVTLGIRLCRFDARIVPGGGVRTKAQAQANVATGTGILNSLHRIQPDGFGHAVDPIVLVDSDGDGDVEISWSEKFLPAFREMYWAQKRASAILCYPIRQGADWNMNGRPGEPKEYDWPHLEHPEPVHMAKARAEMERYRAELIEQGWDLRPETYNVRI